MRQERRLRGVVWRVAGEIGVVVCAQQRAGSAQVGSDSGQVMRLPVQGGCLVGARGGYGLGLVLSIVVALLHVGLLHVVVLRVFLLPMDL